MLKKAKYNKSAFGFSNGLVAITRIIDNSIFWHNMCLRASNRWLILRPDGAYMRHWTVL